MRFKNPLKGSYKKLNIAFMRERLRRQDDPRKAFYEAILECDNFEDYYHLAGDSWVQPSTTQFAVNADMEIKYVLKRGWIVKV